VHNVDVPTYAFQHRSYWLAATATDTQATDTTGHPLLGSAIDLAGAAGRRFGAEIVATRHAFLDEHRLLGVPVMPAAAMVEWALAAGAAVPAASPAAVVDRALREIRFKAFLPFPDAEPVQLQTVLDEGDTDARVRCFSRALSDDGTATWREHATVRRLEPAGDAGPAVDLAELRARIADERPVAGLYARLRRAGVEYGPSFRAVRSLYARVAPDGAGSRTPDRNHEALSFVAVDRTATAPDPDGPLGHAGGADTAGAGRTPGGMAASAPRRAPAGAESPSASGGHLVDPVVLDACLQIVGEFIAGEDTLWLPAAVERAAVYRALPDRVWCHARRRAPGGSGGDTADSGAVGLDIDVLTEAGERVLELTGVEFRAVPRASLFALLDAGPRAYDLVWEPAVRIPSEGADTGSAGEDARQRRSWIVFGTDGDEALCAAWQEELTGRGHEVTVLLGATGMGEGGTDRDRSEGRSVHRLDACSDTALQEVFSRLRSDDTAPGSGHGLILLDGVSGAAEAAEPGPHEEAEAVACRSLLVLKHYLRDRASLDPLVVVCSAGAAAVPGAGRPRLGQSALTAAARAVISEYPDVRCVQVDLDPAAGASVPGPAEILERVSELPGAGHLAVRDGIWLQARLQLTDDADGTGGLVRVRPDATYLVTGGLGGLGLATAGWLAELGARTLVLVGRSVPAEAPPEVAALRAEGIRVEMRATDVTDAEAVAALLDAVRRELPPLRGVVHAAGTTRDAPLAGIRAADVADVMAPKVRGAWHLHEGTRRLDLDFLLLYSSLASQVGSVGQAGYIAGNAFLDALAAFRRSMNLPCVSISWGPWAEAGLAVRSGVLDRLAAAGVAGMPSRAALRALAGLPAQVPPHLGLMTVDWYANTQARAGSVRYTLLDGLAAGDRDALPAAEPSASSDELARMVLADRAAAEEVLLEQLLVRVAELLGMPTADREALRPEFARTELSVLGLDSLTTIRLRNILLADFGADVPPDNLLGGSTAADVVRLISRQLAVRALTAGDEPLDAEDTEVLTL
jgi:acyl carrier protein